ncbi:NAD-dependent epimerase/dehydratase family protein [Mucilaginibacter jinjuensis]|uniref:NAD(P)-dependent oxidoreductase n=1 Tax=Mucilaginibacter jinjuensis TaxID=1176721 RepID=A0ABY7T1B3_9SPHI|nr:NAD(P)-dependent oxidoreductase [Mucilaginibacter jinjuensis]WCT10048.1 NAD(P)-dependent oxidoreductase [Mucilaginibacter jinjuensis]
MKERVLITGASGFVGYHLIVEALSQNLDVFAAVRKNSQTDHLKDLNIKFTYPKFSDIATLTEEIKTNQYDYIIHAAGVTKAKSQAQYNHINATYTANLAKAAVAAGVKKFVFISSLAAGGPLSTLNGIISESDKPHPVTQYGKSKLLAENELKNIPGLNYTILRPTAVYGPRERDIFIVIKQIVKGFEPYIGRAEQKLSFIYVKDLAVATMKAIYGGDKRTYNIADGNFYTRYEMANIIKDILLFKTIKFHLPVTFVKLVASLTEKVSSLSRKTPALNRDKLNELLGTNWACSIEAAKQELGFYPLYNLDKGLEETIKWYKEHKWLK